MTRTAARDGWRLRTTPGDLASHYLERGWWDSRTLGDVIADSLNACATNAFAVHSKQRPWRGTVAQVEAEARKLASWLRERGIGPGDVIVMQLPNCVEAAITFWGTALAGAIIVPVVHFYGAKELGHILRTTQPSLLVTPDGFGRVDFLGQLESLVDDVGVPWTVVPMRGTPIPVTAADFHHTLDGRPLTAPIAADPDEPAIVAFTSGTTRAPKGVVHTHRSIGFEARQSAGISPSGGPPPLVGAPVGHFIGMLSALLGSLIRGVPINLLDVWDPEHVLHLMTREGVGLTGGAPYFITSVLEHPDFTTAHLGNMPNAGLGGSPVPVPFAQRLEDKGIRVMRSYGSTEHPTITGCSFNEPASKRVHTDGHALDGVEVRIDSEGNITSRGPDLFAGYTDPDLSAAAFDDDGWYRTGDVGVLDADGFLTITDRVSDIIIRGGENISAQEVEELLLGIDGIAEVAVVAEPDPKFGERAVAVVRTAGGDSTLELHALRSHLESAGLAKQKWPESIRVVADFPRTPSGKIQKFVLRNQLRDGALQHQIDR